MDLVAADVSPIDLLSEELEPTHVGCYGKGVQRNPLPDFDDPAAGFQRGDDRLKPALERFNQRFLAAIPDSH